MSKGVHKTLNRAAQPFCIMGNGVRKLFRSVRFVALLYFSFLYWYCFTNNIKGLAQASGYGVPPWLLPHFYGSTIFIPYALFMFVIVTCDAPFLDQEHLYSIKRSGRSAWCIGQMLYIVAANVIYQAIMFLVQVITLIPYLSFSGGWGSVIYSAGQDASLISPYVYSGYGEINKAIVTSMTPIEANLKQVILCVAFGSVLGVVAFLINGLAGNALGSIILVGGVLLKDFINLASFDYGFTDFSRYFIYNWLDLTGYIDGLYDYWTNVACMGIMFLILAVISWFLVVKRVIKTTE